MWVNEEFFLQLKYLIVTFVVTHSQGNNGRPGKPGDRGAPGQQVYFRHNKDTATQKDTNRLLKGTFCKSNASFFVVLNCRVLVDSPEPLDSQE